MRHSPSIKNGLYQVWSKSIISETTCHIMQNILCGYIWMSGQYLVQISSNSEMVELESVRKFAELTRNDPTAKHNSRDSNHSLLNDKDCTPGMKSAIYD